MQKNSSDLIYSKDEAPYGISYEDWVKMYWKWHVKLEHKISEQNTEDLTRVHPREAYSAEKCIASNQQHEKHENVWFLPDGRNLRLSEANTPEIRKCTVPHGKALLVQIYGGGCSDAEGLEKANLEDCAKVGLDTVEFTAKIDGVEVMSSKNRGDFLQGPYQCKLDYAEDNLYGAEKGPHEAWVGGYFLFVKPLSEGNHKIEFKETFLKPKQPAVLPRFYYENRISNVVYDLTISLFRK
jgi:hypothetical protein